MHILLWVIRVHAYCVVAHVHSLTAFELVMLLVVQSVLVSMVLLYLLGRNTSDATVVLMRCLILSEI